MANALKCDRCSSYFEYDENMNNYIVFGNKHIIVDLKKGKAFDICPKCMKEFEDWFWPSETEEKWTDEDCECIGCWECEHFRQDKNIHNPYDKKDAYYCAHKKLYISGNVARPDYMDMRYTDFDKLGCKEEE